MTQTLLVLLAPGSVEAEIGRVQQRIFADHGLVSAVALAPLVPVAYLPATRMHGLLAKLNASVAAPYRLTLAGLSWQDGFLYLGVDSGGVWSSLRAAAHGEAPGEAAGEARGFFPPREGFFLGCAEAAVEERESIRPSLPALGFTSSTLAVMRIRSTAEGGAWWREVTTEVLEEIPLRGRRMQ